MGTIVQLHPERISQSVVQQAAKVILEGGVLLYPTETIYGFGCNPFDESAVRRIFKLKGRSETKPVLVLVSNRVMLKELVSDIPPAAKKLIKQFWPGPLTLIFEARKHVPSLLTAGTGNIGVRIPGSNFCLKLLKQSCAPLVSTSANKSGVNAVMTINELKKTFSDHVDMVIDAGNLMPSMPSTVADVSTGELTILRQGAISEKKIRRCISRYK